MFNTLFNKINDFRANSFRLGSRNRRALDSMPPGLYDYWKRTAQFEFKGIPQDAFFFIRASDALLTFFECVKRSNKPCALPSKAADSVWHAWIRYSPATLEEFCRRHFGRLIPHVEAQDMAGGMDHAMATCLLTARSIEGLDRAGPHLPRLFVTDRKLRMPGGFAYEVARGDVVFSHMNARGRPEGDAHYQTGVHPAFLLSAGLIGQSEYDRWEERRKPDGGGCGSTGSSCGTVSCDGGGGGDGGDGGGCGGGCGGGD